MESFKKKFVKSQHSVSRFCHLTRFFYCFFIIFLQKLWRSLKLSRPGTILGSPLTYSWETSKPFWKQRALSFKVSVTSIVEFQRSWTKAELLREGIIFLIQLFARAILLMKKLEIEKTKPTFIIPVLKVEY